MIAEALADVLTTPMAWGFFGLTTVAVGASLVVAILSFKRWGRLQNRTAAWGALAPPICYALALLCAVGSYGSITEQLRAGIMSPDMESQAPLMALAISRLAYTSALAQISIAICGPLVLIAAVFPLLARSKGSESDVFTWLFAPVAAVSAGGLAASSQALRFIAQTVRLFADLVSAEHGQRSSLLKESMARSLPLLDRAVS